MLLSPPHQRSRRRPVAAQSLGAVHLLPGLRVEPAAHGGTGTVRVVCGSGSWRVDEDQGRSKRRKGATVRARRLTTGADSERSQTWGQQRHRGVVDRGRDRSVLHQSAFVGVTRGEGKGFVALCYFGVASSTVIQERSQQ